MSIRIVVLLWLLACALFDLRQREVPDGLTLPVLGAALIYRGLMPQGCLPWLLAGATLLFTLAGALPGGDMKGLVALALFDPGLYLAAWLGAGITWLAWWTIRRERKMPGYLGFLLGVVGWMVIAFAVVPAIF